MTRGHACLCSVSLRWPRCPRFLGTTEHHQRVAFWLFHFLEERLPSASIKIECGWCPRSPVQSKHTHVVQWPGGDRADKRNRNVIIALLEVTLRKASGPPLPPSWSCFCQAACQVNPSFSALEGRWCKILYLRNPFVKTSGYA